MSDVSLFNNNFNKNSNKNAKPALNRWYRVYQPRPVASQRIILLPHASGSASFYWHWSTEFPTSVEVVSVQYPGREDRVSEPMVDTMAELVNQLSTNLAAVLDKPYILFGHSMGGAVAYELYQAIARKGLPLPEHLVVSAIEAPSRSHSGSLHQQDDNALITELRRLNGTQVDLETVPELATMLLPLMRNDYRLIETYTPELPTEPIGRPITVMVGDTDNELAPGDAEAWQQETTREFELLTFRGGHFYLTCERQAVVQALINIFRRTRRSPPAWPVMP